MARAHRRAPAVLDALLATAVGALALALYVATAAPWLSWAHDGADGGDLITAAVHWGVPHPTGYPAYSLLARLFALLPLGNIARRFALFSAVAAACSAALVYGCVRSVLTDAPAWLSHALAMICALTWASARILWSQATIAEVYALMALCAALALYLALRIAAQARLGAWLGLGLGLGLGSGVHLTLLLMLPGLALLVWPQRTSRRLWASVVGLAAGLLVHLYLPLAARGEPITNWGDPRTWEGFWWVLTAAPYRAYLFGLPLEQLPGRLRAWAGLWGQQLTWPGLFGALLGLWSWSDGPRRRLAFGSALVGLPFVFLAVTFDTTDSYVYLLPFILVSTVWLAEGARALLRAHLPAGRAVRCLVLALLACTPIWSVARQYAALDLSEDGEVSEWVQDVLNPLPPGALLVTGQDGHTFALDYVQWVEGHRPDLRLVDGELLAYAWYLRQLGRRYPDLTVPLPQPSLESLITGALPGRAVYLSTPRPALDGLFAIERQGALYYVSPR